MRGENEREEKIFLLKERRKKPRWVRKDKDRSDGGQMGGKTQGQSFFVDVQKDLRKLR